MKNRFYLVVFLVALFILGCNKNKEKEAVNPPPLDESNNGSELINSPSQFYGIIDGEEVSYSEGQNITNKFASSGTNSGTDGTYSYIYRSSFYHSTLKNLIVLNKGTLTFTGEQPSNETFKGFFNPGVVPYSKKAANGVDVIYYDISGVAWSTSNGSGDQTGSDFKIEEIKGVSMESKYYVKIIAKFNCTLYNGNGTQQKQLKDGIFVGLMSAN